MIVNPCLPPTTPLSATVAALGVAALLASGCAVGF